MRKTIAAAELLNRDFGIWADVWSLPRLVGLSRDGLYCERWNRLYPASKEKPTPYVAQCFAAHDGPVIAVSEYARAAITHLVADVLATTKDVERAIKVRGFDPDKRNPLRE